MALSPGHHRSSELGKRIYNQPWCPIARFLDIFGERWTLLVLRELLFAHPQPLRFGELSAELPGLSRSLLASRLRELESAGIIEAQKQGASRAIGGWALTERGASLAPVVRAIGEWGIDDSEGPVEADRGALRRKLDSLG